MPDQSHLHEMIEVIVPSRVAYAGNPSDLINQAENELGEEIPVDGAVLSAPVWKLNASVVLMSSSVCEVVAPRSQFPTLADYIEAIKTRGVGDWEHIVDMAMLTFGEIMEKLGCEVRPLPVSIHLSTNIPRQRGMSGSSGMITSIIISLLKAHQVEDKLSAKELAMYVLGVENKLGVTAGLQDRILQATCVLDSEVDAVFMDFGVEARKNGSCEYLPIKLSNGREIFSSALVLSSQPSHSGKVHRPIVEKLKNGDKKTLIAFSRLGEIGYDGYRAFQFGNWEKLGEAMTATAEMRIEIYGEEVLGPLNMALVSACNVAKVPFNFTGSGGAVIAMLLEGDDSFGRLKAEVEKRGSFEIYPLT